MVGIELKAHTAFLLPPLLLEERAIVIYCSSDFKSHYDMYFVTKSMSLIPNFI